LVGLEKIIYVGNHGLEIEGPKIKFQSPILTRSRSVIKKIKEDLEKRVSQIKGVFVEDKGLTLSLHYRLVNRKDIPRL
jgi:trehalose-phosphatase